MVLKDSRSTDFHNALAGALGDDALVRDWCLGVIDLSQCPHHRHGSPAFHLHAHTATDATIGADLANNDPLFRRGATDVNLVCDGHNLDQIARTGRDAGPASRANVRVDDGQTVDNRDRAKFAGSCTTTKAQATIRTLFPSACHNVGRRTVGDAVVFASLLCG